MLILDGDQVRIKTLGRRIIGFIVVLPSALAFYTLKPFLGRKRVTERVGYRLTKSAKWSLRFWVPRIESPSEFYRFPEIMKARFWLWKLFYDIEILKEDPNVFKLRVTNCPFCEALAGLGLKELGPYICQADWEVAKDNFDKWGFRRENQIGTGDSFCDHTYFSLH